MVPFPSPCKGELGNLAAAPGQTNVKTPLATKGSAWTPKAYCDGRIVLRLVVFGPAIFRNSIWHEGTQSRGGGNLEGEAFISSLSTPKESYEFLSPKSSSPQHFFNRQSASWLGLEI